MTTTAIYTTPRFGLIIIGDEIMSGRRQDKHFAKVLSILSARGLTLSWVEYVGDDRTRIEATIARAMQSGDVVFSCGGIGATPDDHTRQAAGLAAGEPLAIHPEAKVLINQRILEMKPDADLNAADNLHRLKMGEFPASAKIIPNPYNKIPGFQMGSCYFVPGFPVMAWPMIEWVLDTYYAAFFSTDVETSCECWVFKMPESTITPLMEHIEATYPTVKVFSLPSVGDEKVKPHIELGVKSKTLNAEKLKPILQQMMDECVRLGGIIALNDPYKTE